MAVKSSNRKGIALNLVLILILTCLKIIILVYFGPDALSKSAPFKQTKKCHAYLWGVTSVTAGAIRTAAVFVSGSCLAHVWLIILPQGPMACIPR